MDMSTANILVQAQKVEKRVVEIICNVSQVAIFKYSDDGQTWVKSEHEGGFAFCRLQGESHASSLPFCFIVFNQLTPQNFIIHLAKGITFQRRNEYIIYKAPSSENVGALWFYKREDCDRAFEVIKRTVESFSEHETSNVLSMQQQQSSGASASAKPTTVNARGAPDEKMGKNILNMLANAKKTATHGAQGQQSHGAMQEAGGSGVPGMRSPGGGDFRGAKLPASSISVESLFKTQGGSSRNGNTSATINATASIPTPTPTKTAATESSDHQQRKGNEAVRAMSIENNNTGGSSGGTDGPPGAGLGGVAGSNVYTGSLGKGRGRPMTEQIAPMEQQMQQIAPIMQRLLNSSSSAAPDHRQQVMSSAFTNVAPRHTQKANPNVSADMMMMPPGMRMDTGNNAGIMSPNIAADLMSPIMNPSLYSPVGGDMGLNERKHMELLTPADLGAAVVHQNANVPYPTSSLDQQMQGISIHHGVAAPLVAYPSFNMEQFRQSMVYLLEHNQDFVRTLYEAFTRESGLQGNRGLSQGGGGGGGMGNSGWRNN